MKVRKPKLKNDKSCRCDSHSQWHNDTISNNGKNISSCKKFRSAIIEDMRRQGFLSKRGNFLCQGCYDYFKENHYSHPDEQNSDVEPIDESLEELPEETVDIEFHLKTLIEELRTKTMDELYEGKEQLWGQLVGLIGERLCHMPVFHDGQVIKSYYKDKVFMTQLDIMKYIRERNDILVKFLCGLSGVEYDIQSNKIQYTLATTIEMCYYLRNLNLVLPFSFLSNLIQSCISGSKSVSVVNGKTTPGGSYETYQKWFDLRGGNTLVARAGVLELWFDNIGRYINKQYRVSSSKMKKADIVTTCLQIVHDGNLLQNDRTLKPNRGKEKLKSIHSKMTKEIERGDTNFRKYRYCFVDQILKMVIKEKEGIVQDKINLLQANRRVCTKVECGEIYDVSVHGLKRKCNLCGSSVVKEEKPENNEARDPSYWRRMENLKFGQAENREVQAEISMAESILKNPNSYENIEHILGEIKTFANIPSKRAWLFLGCDGPPFCLSERLANEDPEKYDWAHFIPGLGHLHMNMMKTLFKILDDVILEPLGKEVLNFESPKAYKFFIDAKDTHKSWQTVQILLFGTVMELCHEFLEETDDPDAMGFLNWISGGLNASRKFIGEMILNYALSIYFQKIGVRNNDVDLIDAARFKFDDLFYAFNHPIYREVEYRDLRNRVLYHDTVRSFRDKHMSFTETSIKAKSQGGDFVLEGKVQRQKLISPKGVVSCEQWQKIARCLDDFEEIYSAASSKLKLNEDSSKSINLVDEILKWRAILRMSEYFQKSNLHPVPKTIHGENLSNDALNFSDNVKRKREECWKLLAIGKDIVTVKYPFLNISGDLGDISHSSSESESEDACSDDDSDDGE